MGMFKASQLCFIGKGLFQNSSIRPGLSNDGTFDSTYFSSSFTANEHNFIFSVKRDKMKTIPSKELNFLMNEHHM